MTCSITATASIVSTLRGMKTRSWAWSSMLSYLTAFAGYDYGTGLYLNYVCDGFKRFGFRYLWTRVVITMWTPMYARYMWTTCEMDVTCGLFVESCTILVLCDLVWNPTWFHQTTGFIWVQVWWFDHFGYCNCTCALINFMVLLQEPWGNVNGGRAESMCRLTHMIPSVPIKDSTVVGTFVEIERMHLT